METLLGLIVLALLADRTRPRGTAQAKCFRRPGRVEPDEHAAENWNRGWEDESESRKAGGDEVISGQ